MQNFIEQEKAKIQSKLRWFNERGNHFKIRDGKDFFIDTMAAELIVTRIAPHFDAAGKHVRTEFWLLWKEVGYQEGLRYAHTIKVVDVAVDDELTEKIDGKPVTAWLIVDLTDDLGRVHHIEMIEPNTEPEYAQNWQQWLEYKQNNQEMLSKIDAQIMEMHLENAENW